MKKVCIIMSTYNGEKYITQQINSILMQKGVDISIIIRDDGSSDKTVSILTDYENRCSNVHVFAEDNIGCKSSFFKAAEYARQYCYDNDYFAFSDQDDVWKDEKIIYGIDLITAKNPSEKVLYFCTPELVDKNLKILDAHWYSHHLLTPGEACVIQPAPGCSMIFSKSVLDLFLKGDPKMMTLHDSWIYKATVLCGGTIIEDERKLFFYRQHESNVVGQKKSLKQSINRRIFSLTKKRNHRQKLIQDLAATYKRDITNENYNIIGPLLYYRNNLWLKIKLLLSRRYKTNRIISDIGFKFSILLNRY